MLPTKFWFIWPSTFRREDFNQVSLHLAEGFQRRRLKCEKLTDDRRRTPSDGKSSHCLWQGELKTCNIAGYRKIISLYSNYPTGLDFCFSNSNFNNKLQLQNLSSV